jgi:DNA-binding transcriptional ArsR family regulator
MAKPFVRETTVLRALSNPARQAILDVLAGEPSTSAMVARALGSNTGVASYHLRELGKAGLIEPDASRSRGRQRFWRLAAADMWFSDPSESDDPGRAQAAIDLIMTRLTAAVRHYLQRTDLGSEWREAALFSRSLVELSVAELAELQGEYLDLLRRWADRGDAVPGARPVRLAMFAFPDEPHRGRGNS